MQDGGEPYPDNYDEGWYQDESENWLNQFDWKQVIKLKYCKKVLFAREILLQKKLKIEKTKTT